MLIRYACSIRQFCFQAFFKAFRQPLPAILLLALLGPLGGLSGCTVSAQSGDSQAEVSSAEPANSSAVTPANALPASDAEEGNAAIVQSIASAEVVYLAEKHTSVAAHAAQLEILQALAEKGDVVIALEMFQRPFQEPLEAYIAGTLTEAELVAQTEYETRWGFDWELYAPIIRYAKENKIPLVALNTPAEVTRKVAREGLESLAGDDLTYIPPIAEIDLSNETHREWISEVFEAHGGAGHSLNFENFYAAQVLWDETMAEQVVAQLEADPERQVIVLAGEGHVAYGYGIPSRVVRRQPEVKQASVRFLPAGETAEEGVADFVWLTEAVATEE